MSCKTPDNKDESKDNVDNNRKIDKRTVIKNTAKKGDIQKFLGTYRLNVTGFMGTLDIFKIKDRFGGTISFDKWGYGKKQILKDVKINEGRIYFVRSLTTTEEMKKYNSTRFFTQKFYGSYSKDGKYIKGYYRDAGTQHSWKASKK